MYTLECVCVYTLAVWLSGRALVSINEVALRWAWLVLGWVTGSGFNAHCRKPISVCNKPLRSTQPGHPSVCKRNEYQKRAVMLCGWGGRQVWFVYGCMAGTTVIL